MKKSATHGIVARTLNGIVESCGHFCKVCNARAGAFSAVNGPSWADFSPAALFMAFPFSFSTRTKTISENCRKMVKMSNQFC